MNYNKKAILILVSSIIGMITAFILINPSKIGLCPLNDTYCFDPYDEIIGQPLSTLSFCFFILSIILLFVKEKVFYVWSKFSAVFILITALIIAKAPVYSGSIDPFEKKPVTIFLTSLFFLMSLALILSKTFRPNWKLWIVLPIAFIFSVVGVLVAVVIF